MKILLNNRSLESRLRRGFYLCLTLLVVASIPAQTAFGISDEQKKLLTSGVYYFDISTGGGDGSNGQCGGSGGSISGSTNPEIVWNYFTGQGLSAVATAGIMGNFNQESGLDPAIKQNWTTRALPDGGDGVTGYGLAQWTSQDRQAGLFAKMRAEELGKYYGAGWGHPERDKEIPAEDLKKLMEVELSYAWEGDTTKIKDIAKQLNTARSVEGNNGSAVVFHRLFERSDDDASQIQERVDDARRFLKQYGGSTGTGSCAGELGGVEKMEDAVPWAMRFVEDTRQTYHPGGHSIKNERSDSIWTLYWTSDQKVGNGGGCWGATYCGQCTALSGWFVTKMTGYTYGNGSGGEVVGNLKARGVPTGNEPRPFSVFSYPTGDNGHTGVVLGTLGGGIVITIENNWPNGNLVIRKYNIKAEAPGVTFAYVGDKLKVSGLDTGN